MPELLKNLYDVAGSYSKNVTKMFIYDVVKEGEKTWPKSEIPLSSCVGPAH